MSAIWPAFVWGIKSSFSIYGISIILFFVLLVSWIGKTKAQLLTLGIFFINAIFLANVLNVLGAYDHFFNQPNIFVKVLFFYFALAIIFLIYGLCHFFDWLGYKRFGDISRFIIKLPVWFYDRNAPSKPNWISFFICNVLIIFLATVFGFGLAILGYFWLQDYSVFVMFYHLMQDGQKGLAYSVVVSFVTAFILPLSLVWGFMMFQMHRKASQPPSIIKVSIFKIVSSSVFLLIGVGSLFVYLTR